MTATVIEISADRMVTLAYDTGRVLTVPEKELKLEAEVGMEIEFVEFAKEDGRSLGEGKMVPLVYDRRRGI